MIDEQKLIEEMENEFCSDCVKCGGSCRFADIKEIINKQPKVNEWIPVSEQLPKLDELVLCSLNPDNPTIIHLVVISRYDNSHHWHDGIIIAWMPLHEPYRE